jgi:HJR/Mrr/RecB family endonuclease
MAKKRGRQSGFDSFMLRLTLWITGGMIFIGLLWEFVSNQPLVALVIAVLAIAVPIGMWYQRRENRKREAGFHVQQAQELGKLLMISGSESEDTVADLFRAHGYKDIERIGGSGDLGVDLTAIDPHGLRVIVQCKRYGRGQKIGSPAVQMLIGAVANHGADRGIFVTTSTYTAPAIQAATSGQIAIELINGADLTRLARGAGIRPEVVGV